MGIGNHQVRHGELTPKPLISFSWFLWLVRGIVVGLIVGPLMFLLATMIHSLTNVREANPWLLLLIPVGAVLTAWLFQKTGPYLKQGTNLAIEKINQEILSSIRISNIPFNNNDHGKGVALSPKVIPLMYVNTAVTHLVGASGGKEGAGVQVGTSVAGILDWIERKLRLFIGRVPDEADQIEITQIWLITGAGAAFGALFNAPMAGTWFGVQFSSPKLTRTEAFLPCMASSFTASIVSKLMGNHPISLGITMETVQFGLKPLLFVCIAAALFGLLSLLFCTVVQVFKHFMSKLTKNPILRSLYSSLILLTCTGIFYLITDSFAFNGLSLSLFQEAGLGHVTWLAPVAKLLLTALTITAGFSGGEIIPLMIIGGTTGSLLAPLFGLPVSMMTAFGAVGTLSGGTNLPLVCFLLGIELFGFDNITLLFATCIFSFICSGRSGIYESQNDPISNESKPHEE